MNNEAIEEPAFLLNPSTGHTGVLNEEPLAPLAFIQDVEPSTGLGESDWLFDLGSGSIGNSSNTIGASVVTDSPVTHHSPISNAKLQDYVMATFGLTQHELARICGVTRMAIYNWRKSATPRTKNLEKLLSLYRVAHDWQQRGLGPPRREELKLPILKGRSLHDYLHDSPLDMEAVEYIANHIAISRARGAHLDDSASDI